MSIKEVKIKNDSKEEVYSLKQKGEVKFGRDKKVCHVTFDPHAARVSRHHATVEWTDEGVFLIDKSKEGTLVNGKRLKQAKEQLEGGTYNLEIGGFSMGIDVELAVSENDNFQEAYNNTNELEETIVDSPPPSPVRATVSVEVPVAKVPKKTERVTPPVEVDHYDGISSISLINMSKYKPKLKRKSDASLFDDIQPRGKRGPVASKPINFEEEIENLGKKGPRTRKADLTQIFEDETPAKKSKSYEVKPDTMPSKDILQMPKIEHDEEVESIIHQVAAIPSASQVQESCQRSEDESDHTEMHFDRGPSAPNETIKYTNLIFHPPDFMANTTRKIDPNVPNFKRFVPKSLRTDGRVSAASMYSHNNTTINTTIPMIDSRKIH
ncbi:hypothetical protein B9Z55_005802 [Caenorhabditis nigoni]|nr:hypothetical protein B9Z55_005802 [Caenorhabditis nigoni]